MTDGTTPNTGVQMPSTPPVPPTPPASQPQPTTPMAPTMPPVSPTTPVPPPPPVVTPEESVTPASTDVDVKNIPEVTIKDTPTPSSAPSAAAMSPTSATVSGIQETPNVSMPTAPAEEKPAQ